MCIDIRVEATNSNRSIIDTSLYWYRLLVSHYENTGFYHLWQFKINYLEIPVSLQPDISNIDNWILQNLYFKNMVFDMELPDITITLRKDALKLLK